MNTFHQNNAPFVSFCIPTYNRAAKILPLVRSILSSSSEDFEIVVLDNNSTDDTFENLRSISDLRLTLYKNEENLGAIFSQVNVLLLGRGVYSVLLLDKDSVDANLIDAFIDFLKNQNPITGYCEYGNVLGVLPKIFKAGPESLLGIGYSCHHPTGYFFRKSDLSKINISKRFIDYKRVGNFPFEFMQSELACLGSTAVYKEPIFSHESSADARLIKSFTISGASEDAFFLPKGRMNNALRFSEHIATLPLSREVQKKLIFIQFIKGLFSATLTYQMVMANADICSHYHIKSCKISKVKLLLIALNYYTGFVKGIKQHGLIPYYKNYFVIVSDLFVHAVRYAVNGNWNDGI